MTANLKKICMAIFGILCLVSVWVIVLRSSVSFKKILPPREKETAEEVASSIFDERGDYLTMIASVHRSRSSFVYESSGRRDPMVPLVNTPKVRLRSRVRSRRPPKLSLEGIVWDESEPEAVINGEILKQNDFIEGAKVLRIDRDSVTLLYQSREFVLRLE